MHKHFRLSTDMTQVMIANPDDLHFPCRKKKKGNIASQVSHDGMEMRFRQQSD